MTIGLMEEGARHKTLRELRAEALASQGYGIRCPKCGAPHLPGQQHEVDRTDAMGRRESIRRKRVCRVCGAEFMTIETVIFSPIRKRDGD